MTFSIGIYFKMQFIFVMAKLNFPQPLLFLILWWIVSWKQQYLFGIEFIFNIINYFTVAFDQFNASLLKLIFFYQKK